MDKAAIRAKASELCLIMDDHLNHKEDMSVLVPALTQAYEQGWNEAVEAAVQVIDDERQVGIKFAGPPRIWQRIRRLRIEGKRE